MSPEAHRQSGAVAAASMAAAASRRDAWITGLALLVLLLWEVAGLDMSLTRWVATPEGFPWRNNVLTSGVLHDGGRLLGWVLLSLLVLDTVRPFGAGPSRAQRIRCVAVTLAALLLVPLLKRFSGTSCPWDLAAFGGVAPYVPHWLIGVSDGGPGHCFPSGHAVAAFAFFPVYFLWRHHRPQLARAALLAVLGLGLAYGWAQWVRGAHFISHTVWSAWVCWVIAAGAAWAWPSTRPGDASPDLAGGPTPLAEH